MYSPHVCKVKETGSQSVKTKREIEHSLTT